MGEGKNGDGGENSRSEKKKSGPKVIYFRR